MSKSEATKRFTLDAMGRTTKTETFDAANVLVAMDSTTYDGLGRVRFRYTSTGGTTAYHIYDVDGNIASSQNSSGVMEFSVTDGLGRRTQHTHGALGVTNWSYDVHDQVIAIQDPVQVSTGYGFSAVGDGTSTASPDAGTTTQSFDAAGNVLVRTDARGKTATYTYDALNRVTSVQYDDGAGITKSYDVAANGVGRLASVQDPSGSTSYTYDAEGRVSSRTQVIAGMSFTLAYGRDALGRVTSLSYPSGKVATFTYTDGQVTAITFDGMPVVSDVQYFPFGGAESWYFGQGTKEFTRVIDKEGRISRYLTPTGEKKLSYGTPGRNNPYELTKIEELIGTTVIGTQVIGYDNAGRVTSFSGPTSAAPAETQSFTYDKNGNRLSANNNGTASTYTYAAGKNRLLSVTQGGQALSSWIYDAAGNATGDGTRTFIYDSRGRMVQAITPGGISSYQYNHNHLRVKKSTPAGTKHFAYDESGRMLGEYDATGQAIQELIWLGDTPVAVSTLLPGDTTPGLGFIWVDHLNTPRAITKEASTAPHAQTTLWKWESLPFGETAPNENPSGLGAMTFNRRLPGQYFDQETGLHQNWNREYVPTTGRYSASDPIGQEGGVNVYLYAANSPTSLADPTGLDPSGPGVMCNWEQSTGSYRCYDGTGNIVVSGSGYSGAGACRNNPACQNIFNQGPLPTGCYRITGIENSPTGFSLRLTPMFSSDSSNNNRDLFSFLIHGDSLRSPGTASRGCPIMGPRERQLLAPGTTFCVN